MSETNLREKNEEEKFEEERQKWLDSLDDESKPMPSGWFLGLGELILWHSPDLSDDEKDIILRKMVERGRTEGYK
ncbi:MAG TPA: hypothetical protein PKZ16_00280 [bacterium]|nr:hypothetical protein [bacterium]HPL95673.1 hypothetical protein [bacterium]